MARYIICPRCELNFIDADAQEYCDVCLKELSGERTFADGFDAEENVYIIKRRALPYWQGSVFGGGEGNRTPVRKPLATAFSECSRSFEIPLTQRRKAGYALR